MTIGGDGHHSGVLIWTLNVRGTAFGTSGGRSGPRNSGSCCRFPGSVKCAGATSPDACFRFPEPRDESPPTRSPGLPEANGSVPVRRPIHALWVDGGYRVTDHLNVFPKLTRGDDGSCRCRFFLHRTRHLGEGGLRRWEALEAGEALHLAPEVPDSPTVAIYTEDSQLVGWTPMFLAHEILVAPPSARHETEVVRVNSAPWPSSLSVLVEMRSYWDTHEPMSGDDFQPLA